MSYKGCRVKNYIFLYDLTIYKLISLYNSNAGMPYTVCTDEKWPPKTYVWVHTYFFFFCLKKTTFFNYYKQTNE